MSRSRLKTVRLRDGMLVATVVIEVPLAKVAKGKRSKRGPRGKVTPQQIRDLRQEFVGWKLQEVARYGEIRRGRTMAFYSRKARELGMTPANVGHIVNRTTWKEV